MKKLLLFCFILSLTGCKEKNSVDPENDLVGKWRLISYCQPSGGLMSGCQSVTIPTNKSVYVEFSDKGIFKETYKNTIPADYAFLGCGQGSYAIEDKNIRIKAMCMSSLNGVLVEINQLTSKKLVLTYAVIGEYVFERE
ncbi:lipocalin-like domain-containing protein [Emticicia agri]|uniref:Lipocalin-like domain-containing protein n=1 Tax=Emticicia agri TaxID=2492393 RepID=A0A4Q5LTU1_9BACT|nr:lipocalin family protein [Emticicia agri]RYU93058.1 hypothetical protein EWM59_24015 [Emticicia agri]